MNRILYFKAINKLKTYYLYELSGTANMCIKDNNNISHFWLTQIGSTQVEKFYDLKKLSTTDKEGFIEYYPQLKYLLK